MPRPGDAYEDDEEEWQQANAEDDIEDDEEAAEPSLDTEDEAPIPEEDLVCDRLQRGPVAG